MFNVDGLQWASYTTLSVCWVSQWMGSFIVIVIFFLSLLENDSSDTAAGSEPWPALHNLSLRHQVVAHICLLLLTSMSGDVGVHIRGLDLFFFPIFSPIFCFSFLQNLSLHSVSVTEMKMPPGFQNQINFS